MSNELCRLVGVRPQDFTGTFEAFLTLVHPDDRELVTGALQQLVAQHTPCDIDHRIVLPNGTGLRHPSAGRGGAGRNR